MEQYVSWLSLAAIALVFWLLIVRPASRRQKAIAGLQSQLKPGDRVLLSSGIFATLSAVQDDRVSAEIAPGVVVSVARGAVAAVESPSTGTGTGTEPTTPEV
ncbi:preprotein translocase subunit YajC [Nocardioides sp. 616]|uniref:preprotein translocase subunit YajC n=1 Tax=Nocardioides sp. 616 TaxID=2268090 RepID=UPI0013B407A4|nr:preprotein translocase subunit YajC [Nocardioides sp. 616]